MIDKRKIRLHNVRDLNAYTRIQYTFTYKVITQSKTGKLSRIEYKYKTRTYKSVSLYPCRILFVQDKCRHNNIVSTINGTWKVDYLKLSPPHRRSERIRRPAMHNMYKCARTRDRGKPFARRVCSSHRTQNMRQACAQLNRHTTTILAAAVHWSWRGCRARIIFAYRREKYGRSVFALSENYRYPLADCGREGEFFKSAMVHSVYSDRLHSSLALRSVCFST